jgi:ubiquinone/menaquinone biosynthesis C-methylase UbiE
VGAGRADPGNLERARSRARPVGIDNSEAQLPTTRELQAEHGVEFPLLHGNAEEVPLSDAGYAPEAS